MNIRDIIRKIGMVSRNPYRSMRRRYFRWWHTRSTPNDITVNLNDFSLILRSDSVLAEPLFVGGGFEIGEIKLCQKLAKPGLKVLDIGANVGLYTIMFAKSIGTSGQVYSFEPYPPVTTYLRKNIILNGLKNVTIVEKAVSDKVGRAPFHIFPEGFDVYNSLGAQQRVENIAAAKTIEIRTTTLDAYAEEIGIESVDIIKLDIEGAEEKALIGGKNLIKRSQDVIIISEIYEPSATQCGCSVSRLAAMLRNWGFEMYGIDSFGNCELITNQLANNIYINALFKRSDNGKCA